MLLKCVRFTFVAFALCAMSLARAAEPPSPPVQFSKEVLPILAHNCFECHAHGKKKGGLDLSSREAVLKGGKNGPAMVAGKSGDSLMIQLVMSKDDDERMPSEKPALKPIEITLLKAWIDQGAVWDANVSALPPKPSIKLRTPVIASGDGNPIDRILAGYFAKHQVKGAEKVDDRRFARRAYFDIIGLPPTPVELEAFGKDSRADKRQQLARTLLDRKEDYADHWMSFWCDHLRSGTTFGIDGKNININGWLREALVANTPYDQFVRTLINPGKNGPRGFIDGLKMRGVVETSARTELQAAQNIGQVFLGTQIKCATCHDSFTSEWTQADVWGMATLFADGPMEIARCEVPTGKIAAPKFIFPELGTIDPKLPKAQQIARLAELVTSKEDGLLPRTIVNRLWSRLTGRGLVEPLDSMENPAWNPDLLDWLASDLVAHHYDLKHTIELIVSSNAYQLPAHDDAEVRSPGATDGSRFVFVGPRFRRLTAEQYADAVCMLAETRWGDVTAPPPKPTAGKPDPKNEHKLGRAWTHTRSALQEALGRPDRNNVTTSRDTDASTLQALQIMTGPELGGVLDKMAAKLLATKLSSKELAGLIYARAYGRDLSPGEATVADEVLGRNPTAAAIADYLWLVIAVPEFQVLD
jgi:hypothetical protein